MFSFFLFVFHFCFAATSASSDKVRAYFFDVGQGHCFLFVAKQAGFKDIGDPTGDPADVFILIDAGSSSVSKQNIPMLMQRTDRFGYIKSVIKKHIGVATKTLIIVTHGDKDHYDRMRDLLEDEDGSPLIPLNNTLCILGGQASDYFQVRGVISTCNLPSFMQTPQFQSFARLPLSQLPGTATFSQLLCFNSTPSIDTINTTIGGHFSSSPFISVKVFSAEFSRDSNANSIVTRIGYKSLSLPEVSFMIPGDVTGDVTDVIIKKFPTAIQSTVLLASHHGATTHGSNNAEWFNAVKPEYVVFSHGDVRGFLHPHSNAMTQALRQSRGITQDHVLFCGPDKGRVEDEQSDTDDVPVSVVMGDLIPGFLPGLKTEQYVHTFAKLCNKFVGCPKHSGVCPSSCKDHFGCGDPHDDRKSHRDCSDCLQNTEYNMISTNCNVFSTYTQGDILFTMNGSEVFNVSWNKKVGENLGPNPAKILRGYLNRTKLAQYVRELYLNHPILARAFLQWDIQKADMPCLKMVDFTGVTFDPFAAAVTLAGTSVADVSEGDDVEDAPSPEDVEDRAIMAAGTTSIPQALLDRFRGAFPGVVFSTAASTTDAVASGAVVTLEDVVNKLNPRNRRQQFYRNRNRACALITKGRRFSHG